MNTTNYNAVFNERKKLTLNGNSNHAEFVGIAIDLGNDLETPNKSNDVLSNADLMILLKSANEQIDDIKKSIAQMSDDLRTDLTSEWAEKLKGKRIRANKALHHAQQTRKDILYKFSDIGSNTKLSSSDYEKIRAENLKKAEENLLLERERVAFASEVRIKESKIKHEQQLAEIEARKFRKEYVITIQGKTLSDIRCGIHGDYLTLEAIKKMIDACFLEIKKRDDICAVVS
jgi:hypothetical protein